VSAGLPIDRYRGDIEAACAAGPVVITSPTGSGKSTQVPRWLAARGPVVVVQPRRVACRSLAQRVAHLEGTALGDRVGFAVRGERRASATTEVLFVTTGVALRMLRTGDLERASSVVLDELHERSLDLDLLLALLHGRPGLVVMSATLDAERVAAHLGATWVAAEGRTFPVRIRHPAGQPALPDVDGLAERVARALREVPDKGDVLVFLPGKGEIRTVGERLRGAHRVVELHGGLTLQQQGEAFAEGGRRKVVLATNVAETSVTLPGVRSVIDSGLVRRTRYHRGRSVLTLVPVARDAADQRAGRAGRVAEGQALRLWSERAPLDAHTPPEIHRESLVPLVLAAAACGAPTLELPWLDPPKPHAVEAAQSDLQALGALDESGALTPTGDGLFGLPLDPALGRLLVEAKGTDVAAEVVDLVATLATPRALFRGRPADPDDDLRATGCDAVARIRAIREGEPQRHLLSAHALKEARRTAQRLGALLGRPEPGRIDRRRLAQVILGAWPDAAHLPRRHGKRIGWSNGGTELEQGRDTTLDADKVEAALVLDTLAVGRSRLEQRFVATAMMPIPLAWMRAFGLGTPRLARPVKARGQVHAVVETVYAGKVIDSDTVVPQGELARQAVCELFLAGRLFDSKEARARLEARQLWALLHDQPAPPPLEDWALQRIEALGLERGDEVALLSRDDLLPDALDPYDLEQLERSYPRTLKLPDATYRLDYHPQRRLLELVRTRGTRKALPPLRFVPTLPGWRIEVVHKNVRRTLR